MVAEHLVSLPPPPQLSPHVRPVVDYEGQEVPPPPGVPRRRCDHPHGVVINLLPQPQPEVFVDLISDDDE
jgi:hypothetical protein